MTIKIAHLYWTMGRRLVSIAACFVFYDIVITALCLTSLENSTSPIGYHLGVNEGLFARDNDGLLYEENIPTIPLRRHELEYGNFDRRSLKSKDVTRRIRDLYGKIAAFTGSTDSQRRFMTYDYSKSKEKLQQAKDVADRMRLDLHFSRDRETGRHDQQAQRIFKEVEELKEAGNMRDYLRYKKVVDEWTKSFTDYWLFMEEFVKDYEEKSSRIQGGSKASGKTGTASKASGGPASTLRGSSGLSGTSESDADGRSNKSGKSKSVEMTSGRLGSTLEESSEATDVSKSDAGSKASKSATKILKENIPSNSRKSRRRGRRRGGG